MKYLRYFKTICTHKWFVFIECCKLGIPIQGLFHDLSKFSINELIASAKYYNGDKDMTEEYQQAWLHHKGHNPHHWEYWVDWDSKDGSVIITHIPLKFMKEMYADIVGASKGYNRGKFDKSEPLNYFRNCCKHWIIDDENRKWLEYNLIKLQNNEDNK